MSKDDPKTMLAIRLKGKTRQELWYAFVILLGMFVFFGIIGLIDYYLGGGVREYIESKTTTK